MNATAIIVIIAILGLSVLGAHIAEEPLDEVFHTNAAIDGFAFQPLATKKVLKPKSPSSVLKAGRLESKRAQASSSQGLDPHSSKRPSADLGNAAAILANQPTRSTAIR